MREFLHPCTIVTLIHKCLHKKKNVLIEMFFRKLDQFKWFWMSNKYLSTLKISSLQSKDIQVLLEI